MNFSTEIMKEEKIIINKNTTRILPVNKGPVNRATEAAVSK